MKIGGYELLDPPEALENQGYAMASKDGQAYRVVRCAREMNAFRAKRVTAWLAGVIRPGSNLVRPELLEAGGAWYAVSAYGEGFFDHLPERYLSCLPERGKTDILLTAMAAVEALSRNGCVHGSLAPEQFRFSVMGQGVLCAVLQGGLQHIGFRGTPPLSVTRTGPYAAPELSAGGHPTEKSDVFAMGMCLHLWACGELPRRGSPEDGDKAEWLISDSLPLAHQLIFAAMLDDASARPGMSKAFDALRGSGSLSHVAPPTYHSEAPSGSDAALISSAILGDQELIGGRY